MKVQLKFTSVLVNKVKMEVVIYVVVGELVDEEVTKVAE